MTPKEKADQLYRYYIDYTQGDYNCKQCCFIAVDEVIEQLEQYGYYKSLMTYWDAVKQEIENL